MIWAVEVQHQGQLRASPGRRAPLPGSAFPFEASGPLSALPCLRAQTSPEEQKYLGVGASAQPVVSGAGPAPRLSPGAPTGRNIPSSTASILLVGLSILLLTGTTRGKHPPTPAWASPGTPSIISSPGSPQRIPRSPKAAGSAVGATAKGRARAGQVGLCPAQQQLRTGRAARGSGVWIEPGARLGKQEKICQWINRASLGRLLAFPLPSLPRKQPTVLVVCGPAQNGAIGLVCARHLRIFRSPDPLYRDFTTQCEKMDIPFLSYLPTEVQLINDAYNAVVDAVLGAEAELGEGRGPCAGILATLKHVRIPIVSLDVPSGWDVEAGSSSGISPDVLVSLTAPKQCARRFLGRQHFVAGRFVPYDMQKKFELNPPEYPGTECVVPL
ncbi:yjeF N-terminal domain-containing protein 3 isoform X2 [Cygnus olor]|uniref:yjeF N-terminal domain-containing protein 3 isoform X2 n=1 Tax=Cygnus olor TaxID=8869 RepID=UPI001ADE1227|nr:yjeF N-terminal domain-containing protein 3 isoform X2 [Cygnus olor]